MNSQEKNNKNTFSYGENSLPNNKQGAKSGNSPTTTIGSADSRQSPITLPTGGGAIRSIGEKFEANPATGTASFTVPLTISEGRDGFTPQLALSYDSGSGNSAFGLGWNIGVPNITRKTDKGLPRYGDNPNNETDIFILSGTEDLVPVMEQDGETRTHRTEANYDIYSYQPRTEGLFALIERWVHKTTRVSHWRTINKENITSIYGLSEAAQIANPDTPTQIFSWLIQESWDAKGNLIRFSYQKENGTGIENACFESHRLKHDTFANTYLKKVEYGNKEMCKSSTLQSNYEDDFLFKLVFDYGDHDPENTQAEPNQTWTARPDAFSNYKAGFEIRTYRLCQRILMFHNFKELGNEAVLVRSTDLEYENNTSFSLLQSITHCGYKNLSREIFPPLEFTYTEAIPATSFKEVNDSFPGGIDGQNNEWADLYSEGVSGILNMRNDAWYFKPNYGDKRYQCEAANSPPLEKDGCPQGGVVSIPSFGGIKSEVPKPNVVRDNKTTFRLNDIDGDGFPELVVQGEELNGFFSRLPNGTWLNFRNFDRFPNIDLEDANIKFMDVTGDGLADIVISKGDYFDIYFSEGKEGYGQFRRVHCGDTNGSAPRIVFSDYARRIFLADMSGDGLTDIVRITNQGIVYWPNLGYGKFGEKVVMSNAPLLDSLDQFDTRYVHLVDVDGTGTADLLYISKGKIRYYKNLSGNAWEEEPLPPALAVNATPKTFIQTVDLLGNGTQCIVVSSSLPTQANKLRYWELTSGIKPFLLSEINNNMGGVTKLHYCSSIKFYMKDKFSGKPWITKLPFPVHVLEKIETIDLVSNKHFTNRYAYHHGYFDPTEREFRGFGMVEQWDTECYTPNCNDENSCIIDTPPVYTKTWFHTGFYKNRAQVSSLFAEEYFKGDAQAWLLPDTVLPKGLSGEETRDACRALRGSILRTEVYAQDGTDKEAIPYTVEEKSYHLKLLQKKNKNRHTIFLKTDAETLLYHYERNTNDSRILHKLVLATDDYGNETKTAEIAYPRRIVTLPEQQKVLATCTENEYINKTNVNERFIGVLYQTKQYEIHNIGDMGNKLDIAGLLEIIDECDEIDYAKQNTDSHFNLGGGDIKPPQQLSAFQKRLFHHTRTLFWDETCENPLLLAEIAPHALTYQQQSLELTPGLINFFNEMGENLTEDLLIDYGKYLYDEKDNNWFAVTEIQHFYPDKFYLPIATTDPFDNVTTIEYDDYNLFPIIIIDALGFETTAEYDYRVLQTKKLTDPNLSSKELEFNTLGMVSTLILSGKANEGDTVNDPTEAYYYNLHNWKEEQKPVYTYIAKRETHSDTNTRWIESYVYTDGLGNEIMTKTTAQDGKAWILQNGVKAEVTTTNRWLASGKVIYNNKGLPVKQYEPWYSNTSEFTFEDELTHYGVTPIMYYDPLGRLIKTDFPDDTTSVVEFDAWQQKNYDQNDCDEQSSHHDTPQVIDFDVLGRPFQTTDNNGTHGLVITKNKLDITGRIFEVTDALGRTATQNVYALSEKHLIYVNNIDSGERLMLNDTAGKPLIKQDSRQHVFLYLYDELQRKTHTIVFDDSNSTNAPDVKTLEQIIYGKDTATNSIGQIAEIYAQDGKTTFEYDFKGNIVFLQKQFTQAHNMVTNWEDNVILQNEQFVSQTEYNALNRPIKLIHPDGTEISYVYDKGGFLQKVLQDNIEHVTNITYNPKGQRENIYYGNNTKTRYYYNPLNFRLTRLLTTRNAGQDILQDLNYEYDAVGNITKIRDDAQQAHYFNNSVIAPIATFEYDALYRLTKATGRELTSLTAPNANDFADNIPCSNNASNAMQNYTHNYAYDKLGNMLSDAWKTYQYAIINNYLIGNNSIANQYTYDAHGNMLTMPHLSSMVWDYYDQLIGANNGTFTSYYNYDVEGNRTRKVVVKGNIREEHYYIGSYEVYRKYNTNVLNFERKTVNISDDEKVFVRVETETGQNEIVRFQYDNHLNSATLELDEQGYIISYEEYHPFGTTSYRAGRSVTEVSLKRYKYCGKERDEETGLYYFGARFYAAWLCRFISVDPLQDKYPQHSSYVYCANNPIKYIDPDGREIKVADGTSAKFMKSYFKELFGSDKMFKIENNELSIRKGQFDKAMRKGNPNQKALLSGFKEAIDTDMVCQVAITVHVNNYRFTENTPNGPVSSILSVGDGAGAAGKDPRLSFHMVLVSDLAAKSEVSDAGALPGVKGTELNLKTYSSGSDIFVHEVLDEFLNFYVKQCVDVWSPQEDKVFYQNKALEIKKELPRTGSDHQQ